MSGNPAVKEIRASGKLLIDLSLTNTLVISASVFALLIAFAALAFDNKYCAYSLCKEKRNV